MVPLPVAMTVADDLAVEASRRLRWQRETDGVTRR
jgi:hypothetical protein